MKLNLRARYLNYVLAALIAGASAQAIAHHAFEDCADCHGVNGVSEHSDVPTIAGISAYTFEGYLQAYRDKTLPCEEAEYKAGDTSRAATDMCAIAENMTDQEITDMSERFAQLPFEPASQPFDAAKATAGEQIHLTSCEKCHTENGSYADDDASILAGQWAPYLTKVMNQYRAGERPYAEEKMKEKMDRLSDEDVEALVHFYASQQ